MNEKLFEKKLRQKVKDRGGLALKFQSASFIGMPDRIVLMPQGKIYFTEMKSTGEKLRPIQESRIRLLMDLGFRCFVIDSNETLQHFLEEIE